MSIYRPHLDLILYLLHSWLADQVRDTLKGAPDLRVGGQLRDHAVVEGEPRVVQVVDGVSHVLVEQHQGEVEQVGSGSRGVENASLSQVGLKDLYVTDLVTISFGFTALLSLFSA